MFNCEHHNMQLITGGRGSEGSRSVRVCEECGEFKISGDVEGRHFSFRFDLHTSGLLIAASQAYRRFTQRGSRPNGWQRVWKPLDFGHYRLYDVRLWWEFKQEKVMTRRGGTEKFVVASTAPTAAAALVKKIYAESYDNNPNIQCWGVKGSALNVCQPLSWIENGIEFLRAQPQTCTWTRDDAESDDGATGLPIGNTWNTSCGEKYLCVGTPEDDRLEFCGYCGGSIEVAAKALDPAASVT